MTTTTNKTAKLAYFIASHLPQYRTLESLALLHIDELMHYDPTAFDKINVAASYYNFQHFLLLEVQSLFLITAYDEDDLIEFLAISDRRNIKTIVCEYYLIGTETHTIYEVYRNTSNMFAKLI